MNRKLTGVIVGALLVGSLTGCNIGKSEAPEPKKIELGVVDLKIDQGLGVTDDFTEDRLQMDDVTNKVNSQIITMPLSGMVDPLRIKVDLEKEYNIGFKEMARVKDTTDSKGAGMLVNFDYFDETDDTAVAAITDSQMVDSLGNIPDGDVAPARYSYREDNKSVILQLNHELGFRSKSVIQSKIWGRQDDISLQNVDLHDIMGMSYFRNKFKLQKDAVEKGFKRNVLDFEKPEIKQTLDIREYSYAVNISGNTSKPSDIFMIFHVAVSDDKYEISYTVIDSSLSFLDSFMVVPFVDGVRSYILYTGYIPKLSKDRINFYKTSGQLNTVLDFNAQTGTMDIVFTNRSLASTERQKENMKDIISVFYNMYEPRNQDEWDEFKVLVYEQLANASASNVAKGNFASKCEVAGVKFDLIIDTLNAETSTLKNHGVIVDNKEYIITLKDITKAEVKRGKND